MMFVHFSVQIILYRHSREGGNLYVYGTPVLQMIEIPAFAGMTIKLGEFI